MNARRQKKWTRAVKINERLLYKGTGRAPFISLMAWAADCFVFREEGCIHRKGAVAADLDCIVELPARLDTQDSAKVCMGAIPCVCCPNLFSRHYREAVRAFLLELKKSKQSSGSRYLRLYSLHCRTAPGMQLEVRGMLDKPSPHSDMATPRLQEMEIGDRQRPR